MTSEFSVKAVDNSESSAREKRKPYKGVAMEGVIAKWYSKNQQKSIGQYRSWAITAAEHLPVGGSKILEVAPGPGYLSIELAKLGEYKITGLDISNTFVKIAIEKTKAAHLEEHVEFRNGDAAQMPFPNEVFDFVVCTSAFKNFPEPVRVLDEMSRVLQKPNGIALIIDMRKEASKKELDSYVDSLKLSWFNSYITRLIFKRMLLKSAYTEDQIRDFVRRSHFKDCKIVNETIGREIWLKNTASSI